MKKKPCECGHNDWLLNKSCGVWICDNCGNHYGLTRCYCGWASDGGDGYQQLIEAGETIEPDDLI